MRKFKKNFLAAIKNSCINKKELAKNGYTPEGIAEEIYELFFSNADTYSANEYVLKLMLDGYGYCYHPQINCADDTIIPPTLTNSNATIYGAVELPFHDFVEEHCWLDDETSTTKGNVYLKNEEDARFWDSIPNDQPVGWLPWSMPMMVYHPIYKADIEFVKYPA